MDYLLLLVLVVPSSSVIPTKGKLDNQGLLELISWQEAAQEVNKTNILAQVLQEYLHDIELVEAAASRCNAQHRDRYSRARSTLNKELEYCVQSIQRDREKETLTKCVEDRTRTTVSDIRNHITRLKECLDSS